jgi:para-nitrobenzyl esterase
MVAETEEAEAQGQVFAARLGIDPDGDVAAQLRAKSAEELMRVAAEFSGETGDVQKILFWKPVVDGFILPDTPTALWLADGLRDVSLLIGSNADEADLFLPGIRVTEQLYEDLVRGVFGDRAEEALALYPADGAGGPTKALGRMLTEIGFASSARFAARQMSATGSDVYLYEFTRAPLPFLMGAFHAVELPYVFGTLDLFAWTGVLGQTDRDLSELVIGYWTRFATTGDPNGDGAPVWPAYELASDLHLELGDSIGAYSGLYREACDLADSVRSGL